MILNNGSKTKTIHFKKTLKLINNGSITLKMNKNSKVVISPEGANTGSVVYDKNDKRISVREPKTLFHPHVINNGQLVLNIPKTVGLMITANNGSIIIK